MKMVSAALVCALGLLAPTGRAQKSSHPPVQFTQRVQREVTHRILMLPYYDVFDAIGFKVEGYNVTLFGKVTRPTLKDDAERVVKKIEGVERVNNQIEVLPVSLNDDDIRRRMFRARSRSQTGSDGTRLPMTGACSSPAAACSGCSTATPAR